MERQFLPRDINLSRRALWMEILERSENSEIWTPFLQKDSFRNDPFSAQWARRDRLMSRGKNCRETIFVSHLSRNYPHRGVNFERG